jgi:ferritin-like metal-binding protein YciE
MPLASLRDLYVEELLDLSSAEAQLVRALPKMAQAAAAPELRTAFERHAALTEAHSERLGLILGNLGIDPPAKRCKAMTGLIAEAADATAKDAHPAVLDLALIGAAKRIEHYEIVGYECARAYAQRLGYKEAVALLGQTLEDEEEAEERLTLLADAVIFLEAELARPGDAVKKVALRKTRPKAKGSRAKG